ncbi:M81 family metallopeptidase (plasmid) [Vibrio cyclitrophicus]
MNIFISGFQHETNSFSPIPTLFDDFCRPDLWPEMLIDENVFSGVEGVNLPISGFINEARRMGDNLIPAIWCSAEPAGTVSDEAFEKISNIIITKLQSAMDEYGVDAVYLDLHGAMITNSYDDAEGELIARVRRVVGKSTPITVSLDLHANVSPEMVNIADVISIYQTYPHIDMALTGIRAYEKLKDWLSGKLRVKGFKQIPYLTPLSQQCTMEHPTKGLYEVVLNSDNTEVALGFPPSDVHDSGSSIIVYGENSEDVNNLLDTVYEFTLQIEQHYPSNLVSPEIAANDIINNESRNKPVVVADVQDNSGAGATSDTIGILSAFYSAGAQNVALAALCDSSVVNLAHKSEVGSIIDVQLGDEFGFDNKPFRSSFVIEAVSDGVFPCVGDMYKGAVANVGRLALLRLTGNNSNILIVVSEERFQCVDRSVFSHFNIDVNDLDAIILKSTVHYRADFDPISSGNILVKSSGAHPCDLKGLNYKNLRRGVRLGPMGAVN